MSKDDIRSQENLQTVTLEYIVNGAFDGTTIAPQISLDPTSPNYVDPDPVDQIYRVVLPDGHPLGLIDLSLIMNEGSGGIGDRYVRWVAVGNTDSSVSFVNGILGVYDDLQRQLNDSGNPLLLEVVQTLNGTPGAVNRSCAFIPQGAYLGISGLAAPPTGRNLIRIYVQFPESPWDAALIENSCCCDNSSGNPSLDCPVILDISPSEINSLPATLTIFGTGFRDGLAIEAIRDVPGPQVPAFLVGFSIVDGNTAFVDVVFPTERGTYTLRIFDPANPETCFGSGMFTLDDADECPEFGENNPVIPTSIVAGSTPLNMIVNGFDLTNVAAVEIRDNAGNPLTNQPSFSFALQTNTQIDTGAIAIPLVPTQPGIIVLVPNDPFSCGEVAYPIMILGV